MDDKYFRYLMGKKGITPIELGKILGVSHSQINYKINRGVFKLNDIKKIIKIFDMKFDEIFI
jgi:DNA-binding CsgD family transcriptional regulator